MTEPLTSSNVQNVIREWYLQDIAESGVSRTDLFQPCPQEAVEALKTGNLAELGHYLARYRDTKAKLTRGYQPAHLDALMKILEPFAHAQLFPGAGGGGFLAVLLNDPDSLPALRSAVEAHNVFLRGVLLHYFNMKKIAAESHRILIEVYGDHALAEKRYQKGFARFESGNFDLEEEERTGALTKV
ncbi:hypothetical protein LAZ67_15000452 [Cordylochernes scorpioides]|uniref:Uncharacterized protein n=1 Tax=Cordylochernes scorpioides TaxID=51811 RepID=A0ABY6LBK7_9ARAC|nr:hypothetical protein LAZ67_15000452 [Cordylochernes scorpioides]